MFYGSVAWSELPISTYRPQEANGEEFEYGVLVDEAFEVTGEIDLDKGFVLCISQNTDLSVNTSREIANTLEIEQVEDFNLSIDENNTWSLS